MERTQEHGLRVGGTAEVLSSLRSRVTGKDRHGVKHKRSHFGVKCTRDTGTLRIKRASSG